MKQSAALVFATLILLVLVACAGDGKLTNEKAMTALKVVLPDCSVTVTGVQEMPQENKAIAEFNYSKCRDKMTEGEPDGRGYGHFTHYNDGRWVLMEVGKKGYGPRYGPLNIEAK